jgi:hypothetical protein
MTDVSDANPLMRMAAGNLMIGSALAVTLNSEMAISKRRIGVSSNISEPERIAGISVVEKMSLNGTAAGRIAAVRPSIDASVARPGGWSAPNRRCSCARASVHRLRVRLNGRSAKAVGNQVSRAISRESSTPLHALLVATSS